jgi:hypothetical protein
MFGKALQTEQFSPQRWLEFPVIRIKQAAQGWRRLWNQGLQRNGLHGLPGVYEECRQCDGDQRSDHTRRKKRAQHLSRLLNYEGEVLRLFTKHNVRLQCF